MNWSAQLYPVLVSGKTLTVENGVSWGWTMKSATQGSDTGVFASALPVGATVTGLNTDSFSTGQTDPSRLSYAGGTFDPPVDTGFKLGTLTYYNGSSTGGDADEIDLQVSVHLDNVPEKDFILSVPVTIRATPNTGDPIADADTISLPSYGISFHVQEGKTATVSIFGELTTGLEQLPVAAISEDDAPIETIAPDPTYGFHITSLQTDSPDAFTASLSFAGTKGGQATDDRTAVTPFAGVSLTDSIANLTHTLTVSLSDTANGMLDNLGTGSYSASDGVYTVSGTLAEVTAALDGLSFLPTTGQAGIGRSVATTFTLDDTDSYGSNSEDMATTVVAASTLIAVTSLVGGPDDDGFAVDGSAGVVAIDGSGGINFVDTSAANGSGTVTVDLMNGTVSRGGQVDASLTNIQGVQLGPDAALVNGLTSGRDLIYGGSGNATIVGQGAEDVISAADGEVTVKGGSGNEILYASAGHDLVTGGSGKSYVLGSSNADSIADFTGTTGQDFLYGQAGTLLVQAGTGPTYVEGGTGTSTVMANTDRAALLFIKGGSGTDTVTSGIGSTVLYEGSGASTFKGGSGVDAVFGGTGTSNVDGGSGLLFVSTGAGDQHVTAGSGFTYFNDVADHLTAGRHDVIDNFKGATGAEIYLPTALQSATSFTAQIDGTAISMAVGGGTAMLLVSSVDVGVVQAHTHFTL